MRIDEKQAREIAENAAREDWEVYISGDPDLFIPKVFSTESAWMFVRNPEIEIPENRFLSKKSYVISKNGTLRVFEEVYPDEAECQRIVDYMSDHFDERGL